MKATEWTVITDRPTTAERWASWISERRSFEMPMAALMMAALLFLSPVPAGADGIQMSLVGFMVAVAFFLWERKGFRGLLSRYEAELTKLRGQ